MCKKNILTLLVLLLIFGCSGKESTTEILSQGDNSQEVEEQLAELTQEIVTNGTPLLQSDLDEILQENPTPVAIPTEAEIPEVTPTEIGQFQEQPTPTPTETPTITQETPNSDPKLEEIVEELVSEDGTIEEINDVLESVDETTLTNIGPLDWEYDIQLSSIITENESGALYLLAYKRSDLGVLINAPFDLRRLDVESGVESKISASDPSSLDNPGRFYKALYISKPVIITQKPFRFYTVDLENKNYSSGISFPLIWPDGTDHTIDHNNLAPRTSSAGVSSICGVLNTTNFTPYLFQVEKQILTFNGNVTVPIAGTIGATQLCLDSSMIISIKTDSEDNIYRYKFNDKSFELLFTSPLSNKITLQMRSNTPFITINHPKTSTAAAYNEYYTVGDDAVTKSGLISSTSNRYAYLKRYLSLAKSSASTPVANILIEDPKGTVLANDQIYEVKELPIRPTLLQKVKVGQDKLFVTSSGASKLFQLDNEFTKLGLLLGHNAVDLVQKGNLIYFISGAKLFQLDLAQDLTYTTLENITLSRDSQEQNPRIVTEFSIPNIQAYDQIETYNNQLLLRYRLLGEKTNNVATIDEVNFSIIDNISSSLGTNFSKIMIYDDLLYFGTQFHLSSGSYLPEHNAKVMFGPWRTFSEIAPFAKSYKILNVVKASERYLLFICDNKLYRFDLETNLPTFIKSLSGVWNSELVRTKNNKVLLFSNSQLQLVDPAILSTKILYELPSTITQISSLALFGSDLYFIDNLKQLQKISIPYSEIRPFENL